ncbi:hypothetical protein Vafri_6550, partial [Volvox africanus]
EAAAAARTGDSGAATAEPPTPTPTPAAAATPLLAADLYERAAALMACLTGSSPGLRTQLVRQSPLPRLLVARLAGSPTAGMAMSVVGALNNLVASSDPEAQGELVRVGAVPLLMRLVYSQHEGLMRRSCHCLASVVMGQTVLQNALVGVAQEERNWSPPLVAMAEEEGNGGNGGAKCNSSSIATAAAAAANAGGLAAVNDSESARGDGRGGGGGGSLMGCDGAATTAVAATAVGPMGQGYSDLPSLLTELMCAAAPDAAATAADGVVSRPRSPALAAEVARLCGALCFRSNTAVQLRLAEAGVLEALNALLRLNHLPAVCQALMAIANLAGGCGANRRRLLEGGVAVELHRLLRVKGEEVVARAAYCAAVLADPGDTATAVSGSRASGPAESPLRTAAAPGMANPPASDDPRDALAAAGLVPPLVRCLRHPNPEVAARGVAALEALVRGHRANALLVVSAGGVALLAALMDRTGAAAAATAATAADTAATATGAASSNNVTSGGPTPALAGPAAGAVAAAAAMPSAPVMSEAQQAVLWRRCVDLWLALGGPGALVRLLGHKAPAVVERAATLIREVAEDDDRDAQSRLRRASVAGPLLRACRHRHVSVVESALRAVQALTGCDDGAASTAATAAVTPGAAGGGDVTFRAQLVDAGALGVLQGLQGHKRVAIARLASQVAAAMYVKPGSGSEKGLSGPGKGQQGGRGKKGGVRG